MMTLQEVNRLFNKAKNKIIVPQSVGYNVFLSTCVHRTMKTRTARSIMQMLYCPNPKFYWSSRDGDALIDRARSIEATKFLLGSKADILIFVDDDISFQPEDAIKICNLAMKEDCIAGGAYVGKTEKNNYIMCKPLDDKPIKFAKDGSGGIVEVRTVATGFMAIPREVLQSMSNTMPLCHPKTICFFPFFQPYAKEIKELDGWVYLSEDWAFCERARDLGFHCFIDTSIRLGHDGEYVFTLDDLTREPKQEHAIINYKDFQNKEI